MSDSINPDHYRNGPFECIELTRLLSFEWGNVVKYCFRWKGKNASKTWTRPYGTPRTPSCTASRSPTKATGTKSSPCYPHSPKRLGRPERRNGPSWQEDADSMP